MRTRHLVIGSLMAVLASGVLAREASADTVRLDFAIDVRDTLGDLADLFGVSIAVGDVVLGSLTYDTSTPDTLPSPFEGNYRSTGAIAFRIGAGLTLPNDDVWVFDRTFDPRPNFDDVLTAFATTQSFPGFDAIQAELSFRGGGRVGDALPSAAEALAAFPSGGIRFAGWKTGVNPPFDRGTHEFAGIVRLLPDTPEPVPEPGTMLLLASGTAVLVARRRRRGQT
jgi:hypothetical protein